MQQRTSSAVESTATIVAFHDRGIGRETRHLVAGKVLLKADQANEMLYTGLCAEVEAPIANGKTSGVTSCPCYPEWTIGPVTPH